VNSVSLKVCVARLEKDTLSGIHEPLAIVAVGLAGRIHFGLFHLVVLEAHQLLAHAVVQLRAPLDVFGQGAAVERLGLRKELLEDGHLLAPLRHPLSLLEALGVHVQTMEARRRWTRPVRVRDNVP